MLAGVDGVEVAEQRITFAEAAAANAAEVGGVGRRVRGGEAVGGVEERGGQTKAAEGGGGEVEADGRVVEGKFGGRAGGGEVPEDGYGGVRGAGCRSGGGVAVV